MKATMEKSILLSCSFFVLLMTTQTVCGQYNSTAMITPPPGNSPKMVVKTASSYLLYTCENGAWVVGKAYATLRDATTYAVVGNYTAKVDSQGELGTWTMLNSIGDAAESGSTLSIVTGRVIASSLKGEDSLPEQLLEAASHVYSGTVELVSYIQMYNIKGGVHPKGTCVTHKSVTVPFSAEFCLWAQDPLPASVPGALVAPGRVVEGFFGKGYITYKYNGSGWEDSGRKATLYTVPGTPALGQYTTPDGVECWDLWNPNGMVLYGFRTYSELVAVPSACPWSLSKVTSSSGALMTIGTFSHVQTTSTRGGATPVPSFNAKPAHGATYTVPFSAIFWFYVSS